jgi:hypothetical protein
LVRFGLVRKNQTEPLNQGLSLKDDVPYTILLKPA